MIRYLVDTNLLVYMHDGSVPAKQALAREVIARLGRGPTAALPAQALAELASVALRKRRVIATPESVLAQLEAFAQAFPILPLTSAVVLEAVRAVRDYQLSYYDAQIWAVAKLAQIPIVLSEDFNSGSTLEGVTFLSPFARSFDVDSL